MTPDDAARVVRPCFPGEVDPAATPAGEGDYCQAFAVGCDWIFLFPKTTEASRSLERVAALTPRLASTLPVAIPVVVHSGRFGAADRLFVGYRRLHGRPLAAPRDLEAPASERYASAIAEFVRSLHAFDVDVATAAGVPVCEYPFAATEDGLRMRSAAVEYRDDLERLGRPGRLRPASVRSLERAVAAHLDAMREGISHVLLHGELSREHVLVGADTGVVTGIIDLNGMIVGDPARDLLYLHEELGGPFVELVLAHGALAEPRAGVIERLRFLRLWHTALRVLWLFEHGYEARVPARLSELEELLAA